MTMFGFIASGRMVSTNFQQCGTNSFAIEIPNADEINHVVVFMTGVSVFPPGHAGLVFFNWPNESEGDPNWQLLGYIGNDKPSAVFQLTGLKSVSDGEQGFDNQFLAPPGNPKTARIGIAIASNATVQEQMNTIVKIPSAQIGLYTRKMLESFVNYAGSFAVTQVNMLPNPSENFVPLSVLQKWYENFLRKLAQNPNFWKQ